MVIAAIASIMVSAVAAVSIMPSVTLGSTETIGTDEFRYDFTIAAVNSTLRGFRNSIDVTMSLDSPQTGQVLYVLPVEDYGRLQGLAMSFLADWGPGLTKKPEVEMKFQGIKESVYIETEQEGSSYYFELPALARDERPSRLIITQSIHPNFSMARTLFVIYISGRTASLETRPIEWRFSLLIPPELELQLMPSSDLELTKIEYSKDLRVVAAELESDGPLNIEFDMKQSEAFKAQKLSLTSLTIAVQALIINIGFSAATLLLSARRMLLESK